MALRRWEKKTGGTTGNVDLLFHLHLWLTVLKRNSIPPHRTVILNCTCASLIHTHTQRDMPKHYFGKKNGSKVLHMTTWGRKSSAGFQADVKRSWRNYLWWIVWQFGVGDGFQSKQKNWISAIIRHRRLALGIYVESWTKCQVGGTWAEEIITEMTKFGRIQAEETALINCPSKGEQSSNSGFFWNTMLDITYYKWRKSDKIFLSTQMLFRPSYSSRTKTHYQCTFPSPHCTQSEETITSKIHNVQ